jgi:hypothetical protein
MDIVFVKPAPGARVRQPNRGYRVMPEDGDHVPRDAFYSRLIELGDLIVSKSPAAQRRSSRRNSPQPETTTEEP